MIEKYSFGAMVIGNKDYDKDLILFNDQVVERNWLRSDGHILKFDDLERFINKYKPRKLLIGTGFYGRMEISDSLIMELNNQGIDFDFDVSVKIVRAYNKEVREKSNLNLMAGFHLAC